MKHYFTTVVASLALATMVLAGSTERVEAHRGWGGVGAGIAAAVILGSIYHHRHHRRYYGYYDDGYPYYGYPRYRHYGYYRPYYHRYRHHRRHHWHNHHGRRW